jgi:hypothetical protein
LCSFWKFVFKCFPHDHRGIQILILVLYHSSSCALSGSSSSSVFPMIIAAYRS